MTGLSDCKFFSSRLLGQNRFFVESGSVLEVDITENIEKTSKQYVEELGKLLALLPIKNYKIVTHNYSNGFHVAVQYPCDLMYVLCWILDRVWTEYAQKVDKNNGSAINFVRLRRYFTRSIQENQHIILRKIYKKARKLQLNFSVYEDVVVLGSGVKQFRAKLKKIHKVSDIPWSKVADIPILLITGTNGKTTTTRLTEFICRKAKLKAGYCSSDWVMVNGKVVSEGDLSGPTGHQLVLRHPKVEVAVLEVARGAISKRGLLPNYATAATVTNISHDHIGQSGIESLSDLASLKGIVYAGLKLSGTAIVNLDDKYITQLPITANKSYLSTLLKEDEISKYLTKDNFIVFIADGAVAIKTRAKRIILNQLSQIPLTINGLAKYNYENILHAVGLTYALGCTPKQIAKGLAKFAANEKSNFGRWNYYKSEKHGHLVVDIAHNPAGLASVLKLAQDFKKLHKLKGKVGLMYGNTADRQDTIPEVTKIIVENKVDQLIIKEFVSNLRGSELGQVPEKFKQELVRQGFESKKIQIIHNEIDAVKAIIKQAHPEDIYILCTHELVNEVTDLIKKSI